jgi:hypothetical protein
MVTSPTSATESHAFGTCVARAKGLKGDRNTADDKQDRGQQDRNRIDVHEDYELLLTKELGVSPDELKSAVQKVGPSAKAVRKHLGK